MNTDVSARIRDFINREMLVGAEERVEEDSPLVGGILDSMALMRLVAFVEEEFGIEIDEAQVTASNFRTVRDVAHLVQQTQAASPSPS